MRWVASLVVVGLVAAGAVRSHDRVEHASGSIVEMRAATGFASKLAPPRAVVVRGSLAERRAAIDEVVVPRSLELTHHVAVTVITTAALPVPPSQVVRLVPTARGPPLVHAVT
jgi:hypothetical protein